MKAHRTDLVSFAFGLVFLALSAWWLLGQILGLALPAVGWFLASALILIGVFGLVGALRSGRSGRPEQTAEAAATEAVTPVSGASAPVSGAAPPTSGAAAPTSGAALPAWEAQQSTWDAPLPASETSTTEVRAPEAPTTDVIHPAWLAHPTSEPQTTTVSDDETDDPTIGILRATPDEPTRSDHPVDTVDHEAGNEREGRRGEA